MLRKSDQYVIKYFNYNCLLLKRRFVLVIVIIIVAISATIGITASGATPVSLPLFNTNHHAEANFDSGIAVTSRVSFDPYSSISVYGADEPKSELTSDLAQISFEASSFKPIRITGIRVFNHGSTNTIASLKVIAPSDLLIDARSPVGSSDLLRQIAPSTFAVPISGTVGHYPGITDVEIDLLFWDSTAFDTTNDGADSSSANPHKHEMEQFKIQLRISSLD